MLIKSALRIYFSVSYGMISLLLTGSLRSPPPFRLRRTFPHPGERINCSMLSCRDIAPWLSTHSPTTKWGEGGGASHQRGNAFPTPAGRLYGFPTGESPVVKVLYKTGAFYNLKAPYLPSGTVLHTSRGRSPQPACKAKPITGRTLGAQGQKPGGAINPHAHQGVSTFGNTAQRR